MTHPTGWGLIGASNVAREWIIDAIRAQPGSDVRGVLSSDAGRGAAFAEANGIAYHTTSLQDLLSRPDIDAVYISTNNRLHFEQTIAAARAGKHVMCEKPLALSVDDASEMVRVCRQSNVVLGTNHHLRNAATHMAIHGLIEDGRIGGLIAARLFHANFLAAALQGWRVNDQGGGVILDSTIHDIDTLRFLFDENPVSVFAMTQSGRLAQDGIEDGIMAVLRFPGDVLVQIHGGYTTPFSPGGVEIMGERGIIIGRDCMSQRPIGTVSVRDGEGEHDIPLKHHNLYHRAFALFTAAIHGDGRPAATGEDGVASLGIALALRESARTGREIGINLP
ncbi:oxidoreductase domain protein [Gluconacetobacter diazotrophicus PA1 5]|uniref:Oxidoreductase protein n=2 Tax=Gluconacetobacter diazotrophicus TaxID=33996 RepID=A9HDU1_GLUDA|nr:Gfo/Idh/MocA family oxidoreductase [Gluconacetobacter diazotrophicus]ACI51673.1 oxidoreductase domain protein [Gluconacetobacter diazotrophicus PA1 5]MBB2155295.1 Gfo/Idh/MocA family oxidoreductase [Gluconacetobacter diazotrophicus]TWB11017.1 1,5-anhydro-D-fructose reductase (1,5-anhydro-D-mannitol-forming) [Gluconacetobacter diazotrophicus]CAP55143.1 Oxidoreductase protein [Gluconacetobacter diazotrophicus PA1 5]